jgi:CheY-like chemotaxis protein
MNQRNGQMSKRILCVGERPNILAVARDILEDEGYEVLLRATPFRERTEIEALHPDLIALTLTAVTDCIGRQTLRVLNLKGEAFSPPVLVWVRAAEDMLPEDQDLICEYVFFLHLPSFDTTTFLNSIREALHAPSE